MTAGPERYPFVERLTSMGGGVLAPLIPIELIGTSPVEGLGLLDTGAAVNVLPYSIGEELRAIWEQQTIPLPLAGNLANLEAKLLFLPARVGPFPVVELAFAWARTEAVPILLGQVNFFLEFDVCFHRSRSYFEVQPKQLPTSARPD